MREGQRERQEVLRGLVPLADDLYFAAVHWLNGSSPNGTGGYKHEVRDPPCCGWATVLLLDRETDDRGRPSKMVTLFALNWFDSWQVGRGSFEYQSLVHPEDFRLKQGLLQTAEYEEALGQRMRRVMPERWAEIMRHGWTQKDFDTAALIMRKLGLPVPLIERAPGEPDKVSGGKEVSRTLSKPVKQSSRKGQVLAFFWPESKSIRECMAEMGITRSNVLSQLYLLQKDHGIGYELKNDAAVITMPDGCTSPWAEDAVTVDASVEARADAALG